MLASDTDPTPSPLSLRLFGPFEVTLNDRPLPRLRSRKSLWLLALLALRRGAEVERDWLTGLLWPDRDDRQALRNSLTDLRHAFGPEADRLRSPSIHTLSLDLSGAAVDVLAFDVAMARGDLTSIEEAVALYRGPLLEGCTEEWAFQERQVREQAYLQARERLAADALAGGDPAAAEAHLQRAAAVDPLRESIQRGLMEALAASGNYSGALLAYRELRQRLHQELNTQPDPETKALFERLREEAREKARVSGVGCRVSGEADGSSDAERLADAFPRHPTPDTRHPERSEATYTFLFTDIEGSTQLWEEAPEAMQQALARHDRLLREAIDAHGGEVFKTLGDQFCALFRTAAAALAAATAAQQALLAERWEARSGGSALPRPLRVRMALHTGTAQPGTRERSEGVEEADYFGAALNRVARLLEAGHGGQVLLSRATQELVRDDVPEGADLLDLGEHWLKDLARPKQIYQLVHPDLPGHFPPLRSLSGQAHNLPAQPTVLLGRDEPVAQLREWLQREEVRLLTLTGPGGTGKTRLGLQVAAEMLGEFADGVFLVELAPIRDPQLVGATIAQVLGVRGTAGQPLAEALKEHLRGKQRLLVLDNFEQLLSAAPLVAELLAVAPRLKVLATSRAPLHLRGEKSYPVPPLGLPPEGAPPGHALADRNGQPQGVPLQHYAAVELFVQRAQEVRPDFLLTAANAPTVAEICRRLDGLPLAIELAAARVKVLSVEQIVQRLGDRFRLLTGGSRSVLPRQQTLRGLIDWSYDLLSEPERALLHRVAAFNGGWTLEAAEAVCSDTGIEAWEVLDLLTQLVEHSLVLHEERNETPRYRLLETIQEYARERAGAEPETAHEVADRHAQYYLEFAEVRVARMRTREQVRALDELERERDNLRAAMDGACAGRQGELCGRLALGLYPPLYWHGLWEEARRRLETGLAAENTGEDGRALRAALQYHLASLAEDRGDRAEAKRQAEASLALRRELGESAAVADTLNLLAKLAIYAGDAAAAREHLGEALSLLGDREPAIGAKIRHNLADLASRQGEVETARRLYQESLAEVRRAGDPYAEARLLGDLGTLAQQHDRDAAEASRLYLEALVAYRTLRDQHGIAVMLNNLAELAELAGDMEMAVALFHHAERIFRELNSAFVTESAASLERVAGRLSPEQWASFHAAAEGSTWEELLR